MISLVNLWGCPPLTSFYGIGIFLLRLSLFCVHSGALLELGNWKTSSCRSYMRKSWLELVLEGNQCRHLWKMGLRLSPDLASLDCILQFRLLFEWLGLCWKVCQLLLHFGGSFSPVIMQSSRMRKDTMKKLENEIYVLVVALLFRVRLIVPWRRWWKSTGKLPQKIWVEIMMGRYKTEREGRERDWRI